MSKTGVAGNDHAFLLMAVGAVITLATVYDAATLTIPNWISIVLVGLFPVAAICSGSDFTSVGLHLAIGFAALLVGMVLFIPDLRGRTATRRIPISPVGSSSGKSTTRAMPPATTTLPWAAS